MHMEGGKTREEVEKVAILSLSLFLRLTHSPSSSSQLIFSYANIERLPTDVLQVQPLVKDCTIGLADSRCRWLSSLSPS